MTEIQEGVPACQCRHCRAVAGMLLWDWDSERVLWETPGRGGGATLSSEAATSFAERLDVAYGEIARKSFSVAKYRDDE